MASRFWLVARDDATEDDTYVLMSSTSTERPSSFGMWPEAMIFSFVPPSRDVALLLH
eukprot:CAMPEP_0185747554 /NCGR_PEP_ID=MMETSP1174-20130828/6176_1 /TAXON_ID=35687 /ORGANISM="Dictyocha speculum, Strain CCMP1381" /LENGTH=56 /DNA_ID=CAMNT_0028422779 /DNA_START=654 /DNA_END=824 /DNA_ORIENTATION=-